MASEEELIVAFRQWDKNGDGVISQDEMISVLEAAGTPAAKIPDMVKEILAAADENKDGLINFEEFKRVVMSGKLNGI